MAILPSNLYVASSRKSQPDRLPIVKHIDEWQHISGDARNRSLGETWFDDMERFYNIADNLSQTPSFRPTIRVPELQTLMMREANDLSEIAPRPYILNNKDSTRDETREKVLQSEWRRSQISHHAMFTTLMSMFSGMAPLQLCYNPEMYNGKGGMWAKMRDPKSFYPDPYTSYELDWSYIILEDYMHLDRVKRRWPNTSSGVRPRIAGKSISPVLSDSGYGFQMPPGPMAMVPGMPTSRTLPSDNRVRVRYVFCEDYTRELIDSKKLPEGHIVPTDFKWKYPNNRMIVECEGHILQDGDNPYPLKQFPIIPFWSTLPLYGIWATPAVRYSRDLQSVAERLYSQIIENAYRLNNGVWFIEENTGIDAEQFGGVPGEVQVINANSKPPTCVWPAAMPQQMVEMPQKSLDKQKDLQGFTDARSGKASAGNISPELFDSSVLRSQGITQLRGRLNAASYQRIGELMFYTMARYYKSQPFPFQGDSGLEVIKWEQTYQPEQFDIYLDDASIRPMSQAIMKRLVPELMKMGKIDDRSALEHLDVPDAGKIAERLEHEKELAALARVKGKK